MDVFLFRSFSESVKVEVLNKEAVLGNLKITNNIDLINIDHKKRLLNVDLNKLKKINISKPEVYGELDNVKYINVVHIKNQPQIQT